MTFALLSSMHEESSQRRDAHSWWSSSTTHAGHCGLRSLWTQPVGETDVRGLEYVRHRRQASEVLLVDAFVRSVHFGQRRGATTEQSSSPSGQMLPLLCKHLGKQLVLTLCHFLKMNSFSPCYNSLRNCRLCDFHSRQCRFCCRCYAIFPHPSGFTTHINPF